MQSVLIVIHLMIVLAMVGVVLLQKSEGGGLGMGGGSGFLTSRGTSNVLTKTTAFLAVSFFITSLTLSLLAGMDRRPRSILTGPGATPTAPGAPAAPAPGGGGVLDALRGTEPSGPQVPRSQ